MSILNSEFVDREEDDKEIEDDDDSLVDLDLDDDADGEDEKPKGAKAAAEKEEDGQKSAGGATNADTDGSADDGAGDVSESAVNKKTFEKRLKRETYLRREAERQAAEALRYAKQVLEERKKDRQLAYTATKAYVDESALSVDEAIKAAEIEFKRAHEDADTERLLNAQKRIAELTVKKATVAERAEKLKSVPEPNDNEVPSFEAPRQGPDEATLSWLEKNPWYGKDQIMTAAAWTIHQQLGQKGIYGNTDAYWRLMDAGLRESFPHKFGTPQTTQKTQSNSVVAGVGRRSANGSQRSSQLTPTQKHIAKRLGLTEAQYAEELKKIGE